jgi:hypothetical protein
MLNHRSIILLKEEVTYNTDPVPTGAANAVLVENLSWSFSDARLYERQPVRTSQGKVKPLYGGTLIQIKFDAEIKGSTGAGVVPEIGPALRSCSLGETIVGATSVTYKPASSLQKSCTIYLYRDGKRIIATGCRGQLSGAVEVGMAGKLSFTFIGHFVSETDNALPTPTYLTITPPVAIGVAFSIDSRTPALTKLDFDLGIELARPGNIVAADGFGEVQVTGRKVMGGFDDEDVLAATYNWVSKWQTGAAINLASGVIGSTAGNRYQISFPAATYTELAPGDKSGIATRDVKFHAAETATFDDEFSLAFT